MFLALLLGSGGVLSRFGSFWSVSEWFWSPF